jgi:hypothetical protein
MERIKIESFEEFKNVCKNCNEDMTMKEIICRWENYRMFKKTTKDGRTSHEVGANIKEIDLQDYKY